MTKSKRWLAADFIDDFASVSEFYRVDPSAFLQSGLGIAESDSILSPEEIAEVREYNRRIDSGEKALQHIDLLGKPETVAVITGQQPGIFTGPLYTLYKALGAARLAQEIREKWGRAAVPVFWVVSDDHDFEEVRSVFFLDPNESVNQWTWNPRQYSEKVPCLGIPVDDQLLEGFKKMEEACKGEVNQETSDTIQSTLSPGGDMTEWFSRLMATFSKEHGIIFLPGHLNFIRRRCAPFIAKDLAKQGAVTTEIRRAGDRLDKLGYLPAIVKKEHDLNFFATIHETREKVSIRNGKGHYGEQSVELSELTRKIQEAPNLFSPNVALRTVLQTHLFPRSVCVLGPGELAYWAQLRGVHELFDLPMPVLVTRPRLALLEKKPRRLLNKYGLTIEDVERPAQELREHILSAGETGIMARQVDTIRSEFSEKLHELGEELSQLNPGLRTYAEKLRSKVEYEFGKLQSRVAQTGGEKGDVVDRHVARLQAHLFPDGKPQERVFNIVPFLLKYGPKVIDRLFESISLGSSRIQSVELE